MQLTVGGREIETTLEHPFYVDGLGWVEAQYLEVGDPAKNFKDGDHLISTDGKRTPIEAIRFTGASKTVYNMSITNDHTYFVGDVNWGFSVWVHNSCNVNANRINGARREASAQEFLEGTFPSASVQREQYLRLRNGSIARDPLTGTGRRIDHVVVQNRKALLSVETTSLTAYKRLQQRKESRIRALGGTFIRDRISGELIDAKDVLTRLLRLE